MKQHLIDLMEKTLFAYTDEHILCYFNDVKKNGITEHGFPRLTANIGILIAHGKRCDLLPVFTEMMDFCCENIPKVKAANDFSVREIICCMRELEKYNIIDSITLNKWKQDFSKINPAACYSCVAKSPTDKVKNWALFTAVSEYFRQEYGLSNSPKFIETQIATQMQWLDENGMYMDAEGDKHHPFVYDLVARGLFVLLLNEGYRGKYYTEIDNALRKAGLIMLEMQSANNEIPFGGRSNQFLHNEPWFAAICEYEAKRYKHEGNNKLASRFKTASQKALSVTEYWLSKQPVRHIKNRFPTETKYGCENYAYFDKYMITTASFLYAAYLVCDETLPSCDTSNDKPCAVMTTKHFHKIFLKCAPYSIEFELDANPHYDASGLGRVHRENAPSAICMSCPCPSTPAYTVNLPSTSPLSMCSAIKHDGSYLFGCDKNTEYKVSEIIETEISANATVICKFENSQEIIEKYTVSENGVSVSVAGHGEIGYVLPAFDFDGETHTSIITDKNSVTIEYEGYVCKYTTTGTVCELDRICANRNGHYRAFIATGENTMDVKIEITKI